MHHDLKLMPPYFDAKLRGVKPWEVRTTEDRFFSVDDTVTLHEVAYQSTSTEPGPTYTGRNLGPFKITYVLNNASLIPPGACIFSHT
jgi:hypothetical protein